MAKMIPSEPNHVLEAVKQLERMYPNIMFNVATNLGWDGVTIQARLIGLRHTRLYKLTNTMGATYSPAQLMRKIDGELIIPLMRDASLVPKLKEGEMPKQEVRQAIKQEVRQETWADKWAAKHGK